MDVIQKSSQLVKYYLSNNCDEYEQAILTSELEKIAKISTSNEGKIPILNYDELQNTLSSLNEKTTQRKTKGVYYTSSDIVNFIVVNSFKATCSELTDKNLNNKLISNKDILSKTVFDPTCGTGEFLVSCLKNKIIVLKETCKKITTANVHKIISTIYGNDINNESIVLCKIRILLCIHHLLGTNYCFGLSDILDKQFFNMDYVLDTLENKFDILLGNPPYVEDSKSGLSPKTKYGNIYANVLDNATYNIKNKSVFSFIIPLSYNSTSRMAKIRQRLNKVFPTQFILSYADRPDCLFQSVHQKLCIFIGINNNIKKIHTNNYTYWYKNERDKLFENIKVIKNKYYTDHFIPKFGNKKDCNVYEKILIFDKDISMICSNYGNSSFYLNMRATFWIKAFIHEHNGNDYSVIFCENDNIRNFCICLFNSSLYWWFWIAVSDCWHITKKEIINFKIPDNVDYQITNKLAIELENKLEKTKKFIGTKQIDYEYKHRECLLEIHKIDDYINSLYNLNDDESHYIKNFALKYRTGGSFETHGD